MSSQLCVYVKRRPGHLSYPGEHDMCNSPIRGRYVSMPGHLDKTGDEIAAYTDDKLMINFARHFCGQVGDGRSHTWGGGVSGASLGGIPSSMGRWCSRILHECIACDKPTALILYLQLHHIVLCMGWTQVFTQRWSIRATLE